MLPILREARARTWVRPAGYCSWSSHCILRSNLRRVSVRDPNHGMQTPMTVTPDTNRPGGVESIPRSSTCPKVPSTRA